MSKNYTVIMRMGDLFGKQFERDAKTIIRNFENILSWETSCISELRLFENGRKHPDREKKISKAQLDEYGTGNAPAPTKKTPWQSAKAREKGPLRA